MPARSNLFAQLDKNRTGAVKLAPHLLIKARAGSGKTTTLVEGLKRVTGRGELSPWQPSEQQQAIFAAMCEGAKPQSVCFVAFNKSIATELQRRVPAGCEAMTMHSLGLKAVTRAFGRLEISEYSTTDIACILLQKDPREMSRERPGLLTAVSQLVRLCKVNLLTLDNTIENELQMLADEFDIDLDGIEKDVFDLVPRILQEARDPLRYGKINFDDMVWLPVALKLPVNRYDLLLVDEAQDLSRVQQEMCLKAGNRLVVVGDDKQAIYAFAGADSSSLSRMQDTLSASPRGCQELLLTYTRRCGRSIVAYANQWVPDFHAFPDAREGTINRAKFPRQKDGHEEYELDWNKTYGPLVREGDFVLCRVNAPLVSECFRFLKRGIRASIQGRDIGQGLVSLVRKICKPKEPYAVDTNELLRLIVDWRDAETHKEMEKKHPSESKLLVIQDKAECLEVFCYSCTDAMQVLDKINDLFTDAHKPGIRLSSIHKAKGLEAERVFFLRPYNGPCPHPLDEKREWSAEQGRNLCYVAVTRAIRELILVD